jgi:hypothetical protein
LIPLSLPSPTRGKGKEGKNQKGENHENYYTEDWVLGFCNGLISDYLLHWVWTEKLQGIKISTLA